MVGHVKCIKAFAVERTQCCFETISVKEVHIKGSFQSTLLAWYAIQHLGQVISKQKLLFVHALFAQDNHLRFYALLPAMTEFRKALSARFISSVVLNELKQKPYLFVHVGNDGSKEGAYCICCTKDSGIVLIP